MSPHASYVEEIYTISSHLRHFVLDSQLPNGTFCKAKWGKKKSNPVFHTSRKKVTAKMRIVLVSGFTFIEIKG